MPNKEFFYIEEVCEIVGVAQHVIRYWETEFHQIKPEREEFKRRRYSKRHLDIIKRIHFLLYENRYTIHNTQIQIAKEFGKS